MKRLSQVLANEKNVKTKTNSQGSTLHKENQKADLFNGMNKVFHPLDETVTERLEPETKPVIKSAMDNLLSFVDMQGELMDLTLTKDTANCSALGTVKFGDKEMKLPITFLLWLDKQLDDLKTFVTNLPVLDNSKKWVKDDSRNLWVTEVTKTGRNKKVKKVLTLAEATDKHPAQCQVYEEDVLQGYWHTEYTSKAVREVDKTAMLKKIEMLERSVKEAQHEANAMRVDDVNISEMLRGYLLG